MAENEAIAYYRTSSATNVDGDSIHRQRQAVMAYAAKAGLVIVEEVYDAAVGGADHIHDRPGFAAALERIARNGVRKIIVETASRFARDLLVQEVGLRMLQSRGIELIAADSPDAFTGDGPTEKLIRQVLGAVSEFEKAMLTAKLRGSRDRASAALGRRVEGRKPVPDEVVAMARKLAKTKDRRTGKGPSLRDIARRLAAAGHRAPSGREYGAESIKKMLRSDSCAGARARSTAAKFGSFVAVFHPLGCDVD